MPPYVVASTASAGVAANPSVHASNLIPPSPVSVHGALVAAQVFFGLGSVVGALGLPSTNPLAFAFFREVAAGAILLAGSMRRSSRQVDEKRCVKALSWIDHYRLFAVLGLLIFGNQAGFIVGIKMAGGVAGSVWQPSQPVITAAINMIMGWERPDRKRILGVVIAFAGCAGMVLLSVQKASSSSPSLEEVAREGSSSLSTRSLAGNFCFFINCLCTSAYIIRSKRVLKFYPPLYVTAWTYNIASAFMFLAAFLTSLSPAVIRALCPDCEEGGAWRIPPGAIPALLYYILFTSALSYSLMTWANQHVTGTLVMGYTVLQPVTAAALSTVLIVSGTYPECSAVNVRATKGGGGEVEALSIGAACLDSPGLGTLFGTIGVFAGLALVVVTEPALGTNKRSEDDEGKGKYEPVLSSELGDTEMTASA